MQAVRFDSRFAPSIALSFNGKLRAKKNITIIKSGKVVSFKSGRVATFKNK